MYDDQMSSHGGRRPTGALALAALAAGAIALGSGCDEEAFQQAKARAEARAEARAKAQQPTEREAPAGATRAAPESRFGRLRRLELNRLAAECYLPLFWLRDGDDDGVLAPSELVVLWGLPGVPADGWLAGEAFGSRFPEAYERMVRASEGRYDVEGLPPKEIQRREAVRQELRQGQPMVIHTSFRDASAQDRAIVEHVLAAARIVEQIFAKQRGYWELREPPPPDPASRMLLYRNQGPWCQAPQTEDDPFCNGLPSFPKQRSGLYPSELQQNEDFCKQLAARPDADELLFQFNVVRDEDGDLGAVPYDEVYEEEMTAIATELKAAADAIEGEEEQAFERYLRAAAEAFETNDWPSADEAWAKMNAENSRFYLRIGPDEVYFEPCNRKAGFHVSFALINQDSLAWQAKLDPVKNDMERALAKLAGEPYEARQVSFHLPDFVDIVLNAGDSRSPMGATIGQSLPNWGPVANEGRGRTVAMTNLYTDPDSLAVLQTQAQSLLCPASYAELSLEQDPMIMSTVLHEAAHNLGPAHEYEVDGKKASEIFGGPLASTMEELKAQSAALYLSDWLAERKVVSAELARQAHVRDLVWAFGHIARGMYAATGKPRPYSQLAAVQLGHLMVEGAIQWQEQARAANGRDVGCFALHLDRFPEAIEKLMSHVIGIKARGDREAADQLIATYVDVEGEPKALHEIIAERWQRAPKATFVYSIEL